MHATGECMRQVSPGNYLILMILATKVTTYCDHASHSKAFVYGCSFPAAMISRMKVLADVGAPISKSPRRAYRGTSLIKTSVPLGPYSRTMHRALWSS